MAEKATEWIPPVQFYFRVDFQRGTEHFQVSFMEVSGLNMKLETKEKTADEATRIKIPLGLSHGNITLKRPLDPQSDAFTNWINECFSYIERKERNIKTFDMVIKLLDMNGKPLAGWLCSHAYPVKWNLNELNAMKNGMSTETIVMAYNRMKRITNIR